MAILKRLTDLERVTQARRQSDEAVIFYTHPDGSHTWGSREDDPPLTPEEYEALMLGDVRIIEIVYPDLDEPDVL